ncbi:MAG: GspH/FimT family protein [Acidobacteria bacterium]|nr:GspH/FimT family protein [Acidobacteriota bacterium]
MLVPLMRSNRGVSILEVMAAAAVAAVLVSFTLPTFDAAQNNYRVTIAVDQLVSELQTARLLAVTRNASLQVTLQDDGSYQVVDPADSPNPPRASRTLPSGVAFQSLPTQTLTFYPGGNAQGGTIRVGNSAFSRLITVTASGSVTLQ